MYNLLISLACGLVVTLIFGLIFGEGAWAFLYGIVPGILVFMGAYLWLARRSLKQIQAIGEAAQKELEGRNIDRAIDVFKSGYPIGKWQFLVTPQLDAQIGTILFVSERYDEAERYLKSAVPTNWTARAMKNWVASAMLGVLYYKKRKYDDMERVFEDAVIANKKEALLWNVYAYCLWKNKQRDKAIEVLNRAVQALEGNEQTQKNLTALQNNKKMKMRSWNQMWYQFRLDTPPVQRVKFR